MATPSEHGPILTTQSHQTVVRHRGSDHDRLPRFEPRERNRAMYGGQALIAVAGGVTAGGLALASTGARGGSLVVAVLMVIGLMLLLRSARVLRSGKTGPG